MKTEYKRGSIIVLTVDKMRKNRLGLKLHVLRKKKTEKVREVEDIYIQKERRGGRKSKKEIVGSIGGYKNGWCL